MTMNVQPSRAMVLIAGSGSAGWALATVAATTFATPSVESLVTAAVAAVGAACSMGLAALTALALIESLVGLRRRRATEALPAPLRRFLLGTVAVAVSAGVAVPAHAEEAYPGWVAADPVPTASAEPIADPSTSPVPTASPTPEANPNAPASSSPPRQPEPKGTEPPEVAREQSPSSVEAPSTPAPRSSTTGSVDAHTVVRGDSLWDIAAEWLGAGATDAEITEGWRAIYAANRDVLGEDPGLILPGQRLLIPAELGR